MINNKQNEALCRYAALQFPGSVYNYGTSAPTLHILQQKKDDLVRIQVCDINDYEANELYFVNKYGEDIGDLTELILCANCWDADSASAGSIDEYGYPFYTFNEVARGIEEEYKDTDIGAASSIESYLSCYGINDLDDYIVYTHSDEFEDMAFAFTHNALKKVEKSLDNHIFRETRTMAVCPEPFNRDEGDFRLLMNYIRENGEILLSRILTMYAENGEERFVMDKATIEKYIDEMPSSDFVCATTTYTEMATGRRLKMYVVANGTHETYGSSDYYRIKYTTHKIDGCKHYTYVWPFDCADPCDVLNSPRYRDGVFSGMDRMFMFCLYDDPISESSVLDNYRYKLHVKEPEGHSRYEDEVFSNKFKLHERVNELMEDGVPAMDIVVEKVDIG